MQGGFGGMLSLRVAGGRAAAVGVAARLELFTNATSLGGVESLVEHRASSGRPGRRRRPTTCSACRSASSTRTTSSHDLLQALAAG